MEVVEISDNRTANTCDGVKDKGNTAIDDDRKIPRTAQNRQQQDKQISDSDSDSDDDDDYDDNEYLVLHLESSDGIVFVADPFREASVMLKFHDCGKHTRTLQVRINATTLEMVKQFCVGREKIQDDNDGRDNIVIKSKMKEFNSKFLQAHWSSAVELVKAGLDLDIKILVYVMMEGVDWLFTKMTTDKEEEEVYKLFSVNLKEYDDDDEKDKVKFESMKRYLLNYPFELHPQTKMNFRKYKAEYYWKCELLKVKFHEYKSLESYEERRQWLTAHFLLRRAWQRFNCSSLDEKTLRFKAKDSVKQEGTPSQTMASPNITMKRKCGPDDEQVVKWRHQKEVTSF